MLPDPNAPEDVAGHVELIIDGLVEARDAGRLRCALRALHSWEMRLILVELLMPADAPTDGGPEHRAAGILDFEANVEMLRGYVDGR